MDASKMGNFKGVMLCNRPAPPAAAGPSGDGFIEKPAFVSTVKQAENIGLNPVYAERPKPVNLKRKEDDVTWRHKKWLQEFESRQRELVELMDEKSRMLEMQKQRFTDKQAKQRAEILSGDLYDDGLGYEPLGVDDVKVDEDEPVVVVEQTAKPVESRKKEKGKKEKADVRPKWALTAEQNEDVMEEELDDLLDFAQNLDFEEYVGDMEIKEALGFVQKRVSELQGQQNDALRQKQEEEDRERMRVEREMARELERTQRIEAGEDPDVVTAELEARDQAQRATLAERVAADKARRERNKENSDDMEVMSIASSRASVAASTAGELLQEGGLKNVHSAASVRQLMKREAEKAAASTLPAIAERNQNHNLAVQPPVIAVTMDKATIANKVNPSKLPYLFRHPAV